MGEVLQSDVQLWEASAAGNADAFVQLVERHQAAVCAVTYALTGDQGLSEDLAQEAFLAAWRQLHQVREPDRLAAWLCGIARNLARKARGRIREAEPLSDGGIAEDDPGPEGRLETEQLRALVWRTLSALPPTYREPLVLYYREGRSAKEVAAKLGLLPAAVDQRLSRGRRLLRDRMQKLLEDELQRTRPGNRIRDRVAAVLPALPMADALGTSTTSTAVAGGIVVKKALVAIVIALVALLGLGAWLATRVSAGVDVPPDASPGPDATTARAATVVDARRGGNDELLRLRRERDAHAAEPPAAPAHRPLPSNYDLTRLGNRVTVNLDGGASRTYSFGLPGRGRLIAVDPPPEMVDSIRSSLAEADPPPTRRLTGRVLDLAGAPLQGALVLSDVTFGQNAGERLAEATDGTRTDAAGRFSVSLPTDAAVAVVALAERGWSDVVQVPAGSADAELELQVAPRTRLRGRVTREGAGCPATVEVRGDRIGYRVTTAGDGTFEVDPITPGTYSVVASVEDGQQAQSGQRGTTEAVVESGDDVEVEVDLPIGTIVAVSIELPSDFPSGGIQVRLVEGVRVPATPDLQGFVDSGPAEAVVGESMQPHIDAGAVAEPIEFTDVAPGTYTACAILFATKRNGARVTPDGPGFEFDGAGAPHCASFEVTDDAALHEVALHPGLPG